MIERIARIYANNLAVVVVNNMMGNVFLNIRGSLRQGDVPSMFWFAIGIDPLLVYLEKGLAGIPITSLPVLGPTADSTISNLPSLKQLYKVIAYADDVKAGISSM